MSAEMYLYTVEHAGNSTGIYADAEGFITISEDGRMSITDIQGNEMPLAKMMKPFSNSSQKVRIVIENLQYPKGKINKKQVLYP